MKPQHIPTPWKAILNESGKTMDDLYEIRLPEELGKVVAYVPYPNKEDAAFIVRAVNAHEELLDALKLAIDVMRDHKLPVALFERIIAKATGGK